VHELTLNSQEIGEIQKLLSKVTAEFTSVEAPEFLMQATPLSHELPKRVRAIMNEFRLKDDGYGVTAIRGFPVDDGKLGPTPITWDERSSASRTLEQEAMLALCATLLGDLVTWSSEQDGYIVHNVLPIKNYEESQLGWGSVLENTLHVEDAFSPYSPDYLALVCLRNPDATGTTISTVADLDLTRLDLDTLFDEVFVVRPDDAHFTVADQENSDNAARQEARAHREEELSKPRKVAILSGDRRAPYVCMDPPYMDADGFEKAQRAMDQFVRELNTNKKSVRLRPGDMVFIDNRRAVHGREPFKARYDGTDRWLKRVKVTRDLRKSRAQRSGATSRRIS
jgi:Fe(II)/alpha-ketoglutarate-dependent arginine beta-hydroxylase